MQRFELLYIYTMMHVLTAEIQVQGFKTISNVKFPTAWHPTMLSDRRLKVATCRAAFGISIGKCRKYSKKVQLLCELREINRKLHRTKVQQKPKSREETLCSRAAITITTAYPSTVLADAVFSCDKIITALFLLL